jgi:Ni/Co efflux regulator RcnB
MLTRLIVLLAIASVFAPILLAQTKKHTQSQSQTNSQPTQKVSMRQMGMGKMKNSERWKAAIRHSDRHAAALREHGKKGVK